MHFNKGVSPGFVLVLTLLSLILSTSLASPVDLSTLDTSTNPWIEDPPKLTRTEFANQLRAYQPPEDPYAITPSYVINRNEEQLDTDPPAPIPSYTIKREDSNIDTDPNPPQQPQQPAPTGNSTGSGGVYGNPHGKYPSLCPALSTFQCKSSLTDHLLTSRRLGDDLHGQT